MTGQARWRDRFSACGDEQKPDADFCVVGGKMVNIYGTIGPTCTDSETLKAMFQEGMTGMRLNTSHISVKEAAPQILMIQEAAAACGIKAQILIDMQGPELRVAKMDQAMNLEKDQTVFFREETGKGEGIPVPKIVYEALVEGIDVLLDDGKILLETIGGHRARVRRGGVLSGGKSIALSGVELDPPAMTRQDHKNIKAAVAYGVTGVMQPFVRSAADLQTVRNAIDQARGKELRLLAKIENLSGVENLESFFGLADEIVIARGDLGNAMPLWELPRVQKDISRRCKAAGVPFMVVTQMLASMEHRAIPTRAEVSDIYNAVCDGASSVMVTGETAVGQYPIEVIRYLARTVNSCKDHAWY